MHRQPSSEEEAVELLKDPLWRIRNLYTILDKDAKTIPFRPNEAQEAFLVSFWNRNLILKARQRGFSTLIQLLILDQCLFRDNIHGGVIAQDRVSASSIFQDKIKFAYDHLPEELRVPLTSDSTSQLTFANGSSIRVGTSMRSTTLQFLHVSEFGKICAAYPHRAREVLTGSIPTVAPDGYVFIESTAEGQEGKFFDMSQKAQAMRDERRVLGKEDYLFHFYSWWDAPEYSLSSAATIVSDADNAYFDSIEAKIGRPIDEGKRRWYVSKREVNFGGDSQMMKQEYPSIPDEAFEQSKEGAYYAQQMTAVRRDGRIGTVPYLPGYPVNTFWDIGNSDGTAVWFHQRVGQENRFINFLECWGEPYSKIVCDMQRLGYVWGDHYLPHDAGHQRQGQEDNTSPQKMLEQLGLRSTILVPRVDEIQHGIQATRDAFPSCSFDAKNCAEGIKHLDSYSQAWNSTAGRWSGKPKHDVHSEGSDAFRQFGQHRERTAKPKIVPQIMPIANRWR